MTKAEKYTAHIERLAAEHDVTLHLIPRDDTPHAIWTREVHHWSLENFESNNGAVPVKDVDGAYAITLHEMGHVVTGEVYGPDEYSVNWLIGAGLVIREDTERALRMEQAAWNWAQHHALVWTPEMTRMREFGLNTYRQGAVRAPLTVNPIAAAAAVMFAPSRVKEFALKRLKDVKVQ